MELYSPRAFRSSSIFATASPISGKTYAALRAFVSEVIASALVFTSIDMSGWLGFGWAETNAGTVAANKMTRKGVLATGSSLFGRRLRRRCGCCRQDHV